MTGLRYTISSVFISDNDECKLKTHDCEQLCNNIEGSYQCTCLAGFTLNTDQRNCTGNSFLVLDVKYTSLITNYQHLK